MSWHKNQSTMSWHSTPKQSILQSLYFQELSACGSPGLESLGFALRAFKLLQKDKQTGSEDLSPFSMELYKLWAKYNQGIGYSHSGQQDKASEAFDEIIQKIPQIDDFGKNEIDKNLWENLLLNPAILSKAELLEDLQLSYHTLKTLKRLDNRNNKNRLIKEVLVSANSATGPGSTRPAAR